MYLLDANIVIALIASNQSVVRRLGRCDRGEVAIAAVAYAEVRLGIEREPLDRGTANAVLRAITADVPVLPFDQAAADVYARLPFRRRSFDRLIAAHALSLDATLVTANAADFDGIEALCVEDWTRDVTWSATVLTILPEMFPGPLGHSLAGRALTEGRWALAVRDIRAHASGQAP